jgi:nucleoside-diphosphate-sugar epimerase
MRVLIVGCGYVGLQLGAELAREGHEVFGLRRNADTKAELVAAGIHPLFTDITRSTDLAKLPNSYDWVVNCVASGGGEAADYRQVFLQGTRNLIEWLIPQPPRKFVYTGSTSVYGQNDGSWVDENSPTDPLAATAQVLLETENILLDAWRRNEFPAAILRVAGIYGPGRGFWFRQFLKAEARLDGGGARMRNMIHRDDVAGAVIAALKRGRTGQIYNAADNEPVTQLEFYRWLADVLDRSLPPSMPDDRSDRQRGVTNKRISNQKLKTELGYQFRYPSFREGFHAEIQRLRGA